MKTCGKCKEEKPKSEFHKARRTKDGLHSICKPCNGESAKKWGKDNKEAKAAASKRWASKNRDKEKQWRDSNREARKEYDRQYHLKRTYGMTIEDYNKMLEEQNGVCALCKEPDQHSLHVDHNHDTGKVRGLLCSRCNIALGCFKEDPNILRNATEYLKSWDT